MTFGYPEITEQGLLVPESPRDRMERLARFVRELWAKRHHVIATQRQIKKKFVDENDWFVR